jgi:hypothetical protein
LSQKRFQGALYGARESFIAVTVTSEKPNKSALLAFSGQGPILARVVAFGSSPLQLGSARKRAILDRVSRRSVGYPFREW